MNTSNQQNTIGSYFKSSKILFGAFILGVINFGIVILILFYLGRLPLGAFDSNITIYFIGGSLAFFVAMQYVGSSVFKSKTASVKHEFSLSKKLAVYREAKLIQAVTMEASALAAMVFLMLITHVVFLVIALLSLIQMIRIFPKKSELIEALDLSYSDQQKLEIPDFKLD